MSILTTHSAAAFVLVSGSLLCAVSCKDNAPTAGPASAAASASAAPAGSAAASADPTERPEGAGGDIRPVYPIDNLPALPLAERLCEAVRDTPLQRRDQCCSKSGAFAPTAECARTLSSALRSGAVALEAADVDACVAAVDKETTGCDWVTSVGSPTVAACLGIVKGTVKEGALCRSNLECAEGMRCRALGATRPGKCEPPLPEGRMCNIATDSLAVFTGQDDLDRHHPECAGYCVRKQCVAAVALGAACTASYACGPAAHCVAGKCSSGPLPEPGQPCTDACAAGARCWKGKCLAAKAGGESCAEDAECRAHCERGDGGKVGKCAGQCPSFPTPR